MATILIDCENVAFAYEGKTVVSGLDFEVRGGDYLCIVGENGSGKSTLLKGLLRLVPLEGGVIRVGENIRKDDLGYLPQQTAAQKDFPACVYEVVLSGRLGSRGIRPFYTKQDKIIARNNMEKLGITDLRNDCYRELSGGQQQRVLLARALCAAKKLLLLDEPASGLDPLVTRDFYRLINEINKETGIAIIMVSHDVRSAVEHASHILHLANRQLFFGKTEDYVNSPVGAAYLKGDFFV